MKPAILSVLATAFLAFALAFPVSARADDAPAAAATAAPAKQPASPAGQFIQKMGDKALLTLTDKGAPRSAREARTRTLLRENFDVPTIARFALGTYWNQATDAQKKEYMSLFEDMIVQTYTTRFEDYSGQTFQVEGAQDSGDRDVLVTSKILQKDGPPVDVQWRVRKKDSGLKVVDVVVENISMSVTQRSDFSSVIQAGGGNIDALLKSMRSHQVPVAKAK